MPNDSSWRRKLTGKLKKWAEQRFPVKFPVRVYLREKRLMSGHLGFFVMDEDEERGMIALQNNVGREVLIDTFLEEWAHARTWFLCDEEDHGEDPWHHPSFWSEYGRIVKAAREVEW